MFFDVSKQDCASSSDCKLIKREVTFTQSQAYLTNMLFVPLGLLYSSMMSICQQENNMVHSLQLSS